MSWDIEKIKSDLNTDVAGVSSLDALEAVRLSARYSDLVIVGQRERGAGWAHLPERDPQVRQIQLLDGRFKRRSHVAEVRIEG